eukprot:gnl/MRDRNA2_/MRDRNA2_101494_c0_seq1.p1 gnl/MRDRNA2_/MRDRNA2_101494_c0~~gnl/MRDRNA2_/MRDRNA2_101494_c0_seq1.p1  ORF type:complete len:290 (+),score=49.57 gnl/MRDRNA2_/MRDRNA2_101494_c0_seq1:134-1003(+)
METTSPKRSNTPGVFKGQGRGKAPRPPPAMSSKGYAKPCPPATTMQGVSGSLDFLLREQRNKLRNVEEEEMRYSKVGSISEPMDQICMSNDHAQERAESSLNALYLGGLDGANMCDALMVRNIKFVISIIHDRAEVKKFNEIGYWRSPVIQDTPQAAKDLELVLDEAHALIDAELVKGHSVLVHCMMGVSRSASVVTSYVMKKLQLDTDQALRLVRESRSMANPNYGFYQVLKDFERKLQVVGSCAAPATNVPPEGNCKDVRAPANTHYLQPEDGKDLINEIVVKSKSS